MGKPQVVKTWREWDAEKMGGITIVEPDGFEYHDPYESKYVYTKAEFLERRMRCKVKGFVSPLREGVEHEQRV